MSDKKKFLVVCSAHEGGEALRQAKTLGEEVEQVYRNHFGPDTSVTCVWLELPKGQAYIAGSISTATTVLAPVPDEIEQEQRVQFMRDLCTIIQDHTGCSVNESIVTALNVSEAKRYAATSRSRFHPRKAKGLMLKLLTRTLVGRPTKGYLTTSLNMPK